MNPNLSAVSLDATSRTWLLKRARFAIASHFARAPLLSAHDTPLATEQLRGCFVSLHSLVGDLRGCVGTFEAERPLWQQVQDMAVAAATRDSRFRPLESDELEGCMLEISALTQRQPSPVGQIQVGRDGLWVQQGPFRGVLLPQVATAYKWDRETFLDQTCIKAGLAADTWRDGSVQICTFQAEVFSEAERLL